MTYGPRIWVLGAPGVGKRTLIRALGGTAGDDQSHRQRRQQQSRTQRRDYFSWSPATAAPSAATGNAPVTCCGPLTMVAVDLDAPNCSSAGMTIEALDVDIADRDIIVFAFDLTAHSTLTTALGVTAALSDSLQDRRQLLVGTKRDQRARRGAFAEDAASVAAVHFDAYAEICATQPPFEGIRYVRQLLSVWVTEVVTSSSPQQPSTPAAVDSPRSEEPMHAQRRDGRRCLHASLWLYDPTEEALDGAEQPTEDVRLRPIAQALFHMREAAQEKTKSLQRKRDGSMTQLVTRSRYYGPTESSRHMRWQAYQQQQQQQQARQHYHHHPLSLSPSRVRPVSSGIWQQRRASESFIPTTETRSYAHATKLSQQRMEERRQSMKKQPATTAAGRPPPPPSNLPRRQRSSATRVVASPSPSPEKRTAIRTTMGVVRNKDPGQRRPVTPTSPSSPVRPPPGPLLLDPPPSLRSRQASAFDAAECDDLAGGAIEAPNKHGNSRAPKHDFDREAEPDERSDSTHGTHEAAGDSRDSSRPHKLSAIASDIDDVLDYFDGFTLPL